MMSASSSNRLVGSRTKRILIMALLIILLFLVTSIHQATVVLGIPKQNRIIQDMPNQIKTGNLSTTNSTRVAKNDAESGMIMMNTTKQETTGNVSTTNRVVVPNGGRTSIINATTKQMNLLSSKTTTTAATAATTTDEITQIAASIGIGTWDLPNFSSTTSKDRTQQQPVVVDILSIGSITRNDYQIAQLQSWASHVSVRNFFHATEETVDVNVTSPLKRDLGNIMSCLETLSSNKRIRKHVQNCIRHNEEHQKIISSTKRNNDESFSMARDMKYSFFDKRWLFNKKNPAGWACAQRRVGYGIGRLGKLYREHIHMNKLKNLNLPTKANINILPDYLVLVDDDTYYNLEAILDYLRQPDKNRSTSTSSNAPDNNEAPQVHVGCLNLFPSPSNFSAPEGGFGTIFNRGALLKLMITTIHHCHNGTYSNITSKASEKMMISDDDDDDWNRQVCLQLEDNFIDEQPLYRPGMTVSDLIVEYSSRPMHCLHSDWTVGYFVNYYSLSKQWTTNTKRRRMFPYKGFVHGQQHDDEAAQCKYTGKKCNSKSDMCHYVDPKIMKTVTKEIYQGNPSQFRTAFDLLEKN